MAADGGSVSSSSEQRTSAADRAGDRWLASATADEVVDETVVDDGERGDERAHDQKPSRPARSRSGGKEFVRANARLLTAVALLVVGIVLVILGWYGAAYTNILTEQIPYLISGGLLGSALIIVAGFLASSASLERENRELRRDLVRTMSSMGARGGSPAFDGEAAPSNDGKVFTVPGGHSYHVAGCPIIEGKQTSSVAMRDAVKSGLGTCKLCGPS